VFAELASVEARTPVFLATQLDVGVSITERAARVEPIHGPRPAAGLFNFGDRIFGGLTAGFAGLIGVILIAMFAVLVIQSRTTISQFGLGFLTSSTWDPSRDIYGAAPAILGTLYTSALALLLAAPIGILVAIFLTEIAPRRIRFPLGFVVELLAAVPSIVYGLWALFVLVPLIAQHVQPWFIDHFGNTALFSGYPIGLGYFTAAIILAVMILPTIASITRDVMLSVPNSQRDAMLALGATRWEMIWKVVIPYVRSGIIGAVILALGRAVGETMAVQMVIGNSLSAFHISLFTFGTTMPATIVTQFAESAGLQKAALIELALILMLLTVGLNVLARLLVARTGERAAGRRSLASRLHIPTHGWQAAVRRYPVRKATNYLGTVLTVLCVVAAIVPLGAMLYYVIQQGGSVINLDFFTHEPVAVTETGGGMAPEIVGTLYLVGLACCVGLPIGLLSGIYLARSTNIRFANSIRFVTDVVAGTPSIIAGIVAFALVVIPMGHFSAVAGGIALGLLMFPTVTRATEAAIRLVPAPIREAALALGLPEWKTMARIVIPAAANGIITAIMLGIARVAGETAPLVFTTFGTDAYPGSPLSEAGALPLKIWNYAQGPYQNWHEQAWAGALTLFAIIVILNLSARLLTFRLSKRAAAA
jgi:phosphate ABC transporter permease protein PstC/phosphate ABC transporter permease subunit PstA